MKASQLLETGGPALIWDLVRTVSKRAKVPVPGFTLNPIQRTGAGLVFGEIPVLNLNPRELRALEWTTEELKGILAHEIGHIALGHVFILGAKRTQEENWRMEFSADDFALKIGLGLNLAAGLSAYYIRRAKNPDKTSADLDVPTDTHPALKERILRLEPSFELPTLQPSV